MDDMNQDAGIGGHFYSMCLDEESPTQIFTEQIGDHSFGIPPSYKAATHAPPNYQTPTHVSPGPSATDRRFVLWGAREPFPWAAYQLPSPATQPPPGPAPFPFGLPGTNDRYPPIEAGPGTMMGTLVDGYPDVFFASPFILYGRHLLRRNEWLYKPSLYQLIPTEFWRFAESLIREANQMAPCLVEEGYITVRDALSIFHHCVRPLVQTTDQELVQLVMWLTKDINRGFGMDHVNILLALSAESVM